MELGNMRTGALFWRLRTFWLVEYHLLLYILDGGSGYGWMWMALMGLHVDYALSMEMV
jgi:hypothetical protein